MLGRLAVVLIATLREKLRGASIDSLSSPAGRMKGIKDYFAGYGGGPPQEVLAMRKKAPGA